MSYPILRRKAYNALKQWKDSDLGSTAVLVSGARRTGKSFLVRMFAENEYRSYILVDFMRVPPRIKESFLNDAGDLNLLYNKLSLEYGVRLYPRESAIVFDEVELFPRAREIVKVLVEDGRFDIIETGSFLSIKTNVEGILIPSEESEIILNPLDFEEFLWALGDDSSVPLMREFYERRQPLGEGPHKRIMNLYRQYMLVGGMPQAVLAYVENHEFRDVDKKKRDILRLYREDAAKYAGANRISVESIFDTIPGMLNSKYKRFSESSLVKDPKSRGFNDSFMWLCDSRVVNPCFNSTDPSIGLGMYSDRASMKLYMADTGLLVTHAVSELGMDADRVYADLLMDRMNLNEGMFAENLVAQTLVANGRRLFFYSRSDPDTRRNSIEIDFLVMKDGKVCPLEVKSSRSTKHVSLDKFMERFGKRIGQPVILCLKDIEERDGILYLPIYMSMFLRRRRS